MFAIFFSRGRCYAGMAWCLLLFILSVQTACRHERLYSCVVQVDGGYGYVILHGQDTLIVQPYMPAVGGKVPFTTKKHAQAVAEEVCRRLQEGKSPALNWEDVEKLRDK